VGAVVALPLVLPPSVLGFYLLVTMGPNGPVGQLTQALGIGLLPFTFWGLVVGSVFYSLPFMVQPVQNAFEAIGERPLEAAATLRASPLDSFFTVALPLALPGFVTAGILSFAHTVGEFGVVLMIGGNIPGVTRVASVQIYDYVEALEYGDAHRWRRSCWCSRSWCCWRSIPGDRTRRSDLMVQQGISARFHVDWPGFSLDVDEQLPARGVTALFGHSGSGKTTLLRCIAGLEHAASGDCRFNGEVWQDEDTWVPTHRRPDRLCVSGGEPVPAPERARQPALRPAAQPKPSMRGRARFSLEHAIELLGIGHLLKRKPAACPAASASASASPARWPSTRGCC
jgi:molybdate ABC transporter permease protein